MGEFFADGNGSYIVKVVMFPTFDDASQAVLDDKGALQGGTPRKVVEWLCFKELSPFLFESFMRVYPLYGVAPAALLELCQEIHGSVPKAHKMQVVSFVNDWILRRYVADFKGRPSLWTSALSLVPSEDRAPLLNVKEEGDRQVPRILDLTQLSNTFDRKRCMAFQRWNSRALCETITMVGHELFCVMPPHEMCGPESSRPMLNRQIEFFSRMSNLVVWSITRSVFPMALVKE